MRPAALLLALALTGCGGGSVAVGSNPADTAKTLDRLSVMSKSMAYDGRVAKGAFLQNDLAMGCFYGRRMAATAAEIKQMASTLPQAMRQEVTVDQALVDEAGATTKALCDREGY